MFAEQMAGLQYSPRFTSSLGRLLDLASLLLTHPWLVTASLLASSLLALVPDPRPAWRRLADTAVTAPLLLGLSYARTPALGHHLHPLSFSTILLCRYSET